MRATRDFDNYRGPEKPDRLEWAGLPIEYWIDLEVFEGSPLFEILEDLCHRFPERSRQQHIELIAARLAERSRKDEIGFSLVNGEATTEVSISDALAQLRLAGTWNVNYDEHLLVWQKPRTLERLRRRFLKLWATVAGESGNWKLSFVAYLVAWAVTQVLFIVMLLRWFSIAAMIPFLAIELTLGYFVADYFFDIWRAKQRK
jgi:hypothetical protein